MSKDADDQAIILFQETIRKTGDRLEDDETVELLWAHGIRASSLSTDPDQLWFRAYVATQRERRGLAQRGD